MDIKFDISNGNIFLDGKEVAPTYILEFIKLLNEKNGDANLAIDSNNEFQFGKKITTLSSTASLVVRFDGKIIKSLCILFDEIEFFDKSIMESRIVKRFEKKYNVRIESPCPTVARIGNFSWGDASFQYDPRQGDLSLCLSYISTNLQMKPFYTQTDYGY